ncbi:MAG TPA: hypothetical protein VFG23_04575 [Polyangia bacterium]|nr:hypothetical protein [Polyangia bacterium]
MSNDDEYTIDCATTAGAATLRGVLRLQSTEAYDKLFEPIRRHLLVPATAYAIDLSEVVLMNSSGIRALAGLVLVAKENRVVLTLLVHGGIPWQKKTIASLKLLDGRLVVRGR